MHVAWNAWMLGFEHEVVWNGLWFHLSGSQFQPPIFVDLQTGLDCPKRWGYSWKHVFHLGIHVAFEQKIQVWCFYNGTKWWPWFVLAFPCPLGPKSGTSDFVERWVLDPNCSNEKKTATLVIWGYFDRGWTPTRFMSGLFHKPWKNWIPSFSTTYVCLMDFVSEFFFTWLKCGSGIANIGT